MKKVVIIVAVSLLVIASLVGGVFAIYSANNNAGDGDGIVAKNFIVDGNTATVNTVGDKVALAPGDKQYSYFSLTKAGGVGDVIVTVSINLDSRILPLNISLRDQKSGNTLIAPITADYAEGENVYTFLLTGDSEVRTFKVVVSWPSTDNDADYADEAASYTVNITSALA